MYKYRNIVILLVFIGINHSFAQMANKNSWKRQRHEVFFGIGAANFLGDLGGRDQIGKDYSYADLELSLTRPSFTVGHRYRLSRNFAVRTDFNYMKLWGDDKLTEDPYRNNRNLHFKSNIFELSTHIEFAYYFGDLGNRYHIKNTFSRRMKSYNHYIYIFQGVGLFYFNPKAKYQDNWFALQPLSTEGQGLPGGPKKYRRVSVSLPLGLGYRITLQRKYSIGIEYSFRKTFTDYIDDVSTKYYDKNLLLQYKGPIAVALADPSLGDIPTATMPNADGSGAQRGDNEFDSYMSVELKFGYILDNKLKKRKTTRAKF